MLELPPCSAMFPPTSQAAVHINVCPDSYYIYYYTQKRGAYKQRL